MSFELSTVLNFNKQAVSVHRSGVLLKLPEPTPSHRNCIKREAILEFIKPLQFGSEMSLPEGGLGAQNDVYKVVNTLLDQFNGPANQFRVPLYQSEALAENDALYSFFQAMYKLTKNMPYAYQLKVRSMVYNAVSGVEAEVFNRTVASTVCTPTSQTRP